MTKRELWEKAKMLPLLPGVYIIRDKTGEIIYIGKAKRLRTRVSQYFREGVPHDAKVTKMIQNAFEFDVIVTQSEFEALVLECSQVQYFIEGRQGIQLCEGDKGSIPAHFGRAAKGRRQCRLHRPVYLQLCRARNGGDRMQCVPPAALQQKIPPGYRQRPSLPERAHRPVHGRVQRKNLPGGLQ